MSQLRNQAFPFTGPETKTRATPCPILGDYRWPPGDEFVGLNANPRYHARLVETGAIKDGARIYVSRKQAFENPVFQQFAPLALRREFQPIITDMIPNSSWSSSLAKLLTKASWDAIRRQCCTDAGFACECCGTEPLPLAHQKNSPVEVHEIWSFEEPESGQPGDWGIQHLQGLMCLCRDCHLMFHPGLANVRGKSGLINDRLGSLNEWNDAQLNANASRNNANYRRRSQYLWALDVSALDRLAPGAQIVINGEWEADGEVLRHRQTGNETVLMGRSFRLQNALNETSETVIGYR